MLIKIYSTKTFVVKDSHNGQETELLSPSH